MSHLSSLVMRNIRIFYRTKWNVFFAFMAVIILVVLHFAIFRNMNTDSWANMFIEYGIDRLYFQWLVDSMMFAAIIPIGAVSMSLTALEPIVKDKEIGSLSDFLVAPIKRTSLMVSYLASSFVVCFVLLLAIILFYKVYFFAFYGILFTAYQFLIILMVLLGSIVFANVFMLLLLSFLKTQSGMSAVGSIVGTMIGFLAGAYIPLGIFGDFVRNLFSALPFAQLTTLSRQAFFHNLENVTPFTADMFGGNMGMTWGLTLWLGESEIPTWGIAAMTAAVTVLAAVVLVYRFRRMNKED